MLETSTTSTSLINSTSSQELSSSPIPKLSTTTQDLHSSLEETSQGKITSQCMTVMVMVNRLKSAPESHAVSYSINSPPRVAQTYLTPAAIDGGWATWTLWSICSATCGDGGIQTRTRNCTRPSPAFGGKLCVGVYQETTLCSHPRPCRKCPIYHC